MSTPVLHVLAGPNGAGKTTFVERVLEPATHLPFVNADRIASRIWPGREEAHAYQASQIAAHERADAFLEMRSFITETVFSHPSKLELIQQAIDYGYLVTLHVILIPEDVTVKRVDYRVAHGGHTVPEHKIRERYRRLWALVAAARTIATHTTFYDNSTAKTPFKPVATFERGIRIGEPTWPAWAPAALLDLET